jgi:hypothetical protein
MVLAILREVKGIVEAANRKTEFPTDPLPQEYVTPDVAAILEQQLAANARRSVEGEAEPTVRVGTPAEAAWMGRGTGRNT